MTKKKETKKTQKTEKKNNNALFSVYGARLSKSGERVNVSLVRGKDDNKEWATISIKLGESSSKVKARIKDDLAYLKIPMLQVEEDDEEDNDALDF